MNWNGERIVAALDKALSLIEKAAVIVSVFCLIAMLGLIIGDTVGRLFGFPVGCSRELSGYLMVAIIFLPAAYALRRKQHVAVEILTVRLRSKTGAILLVATDIIMFVITILLVKSCWELATTSYAYGSRSNTLLMVPLYLPQLSLALGMSLLTIEAAVETIRSIFTYVRQR